MDALQWAPTALKVHTWPKLVRATEAFSRAKRKWLKSTRKASLKSNSDWQFGKHPKKLEKPAHLFRKPEKT
jgi:hypothetical protein